MTTGEVVESVTPQRVKLKSGKELKAHTLVWGAGLQGNALVQSLGLELERGNRIAVDGELRLPSHPEVFVVGDVAAITDSKTQQVLPQLGSVALQSGEHAGETIARLVAGKEPKPFKYHDKGTMATIGRGAAVVQMMGGRTMKGKTAQVAWGTVHLALLPTNERPREGDCRLGRRGAHAPALGADHRRDVTDAASELFERLGAVEQLPLLEAGERHHAASSSRAASGRSAGGSPSTRARSPWPAGTGRPTASCGPTGSCSRGWRPAR